MCDYEYGWGGWCGGVFVEQCQQFFVGVEIEGGCGFVEEQQFRVGYNCLCDLYVFLFVIVECVEGVIGQVFQMLVVQYMQCVVFVDGFVVFVLVIEDGVGGGEDCVQDGFVVGDVFGYCG